MKPIQYRPVRSTAASVAKPRAGAVKLESNEPPMGLIYGREPQSTNEWNMARALWKLGWDFQYQVPILSGRRIRGGQVLDFLVPTVPQSTALRIQGEYWHRNNVLEELKADDIQRYLGEPVRVLDAKDSESNTYEAAFQFVLQKIGRA